MLFIASIIMECQGNYEPKSLSETIKDIECKRAASLMGLVVYEPSQWTEKDFEKAAEVLKKKGFSQEVIDELNKPW